MRHRAPGKCNIESAQKEIQHLCLCRNLSCSDPFFRFYVCVFPGQVLAFLLLAGYHPVCLYAKLGSILLWENLPHSMGSSKGLWCVRMTFWEPSCRLLVGTAALLFSSPARVPRVWVSTPKGFAPTAARCWLHLLPFWGSRAMSR